MASTRLEIYTEGVMKNLNTLCEKMETLIESNENISEAKKEVLKTISRTERRTYFVIALIQVSFTVFITMWVKQ